MEQDDVFKALADESRRKLLDTLFQRDGQTLTELQAELTRWQVQMQQQPMTRFGCMKHLQVLEDAGLITTRKVGREKYHYLNPVPIQVVYDRWVSKYAQPWAQALVGLKNALEENDMDEKPSHVFEIFIRTSPEKLWQALTSGEITRHYYFGSQVEGNWQPGGTYRYPNPQGGYFVEGEVLEIDPPRRLVTTFRSLFQSEEESKRTSTVTWEIEPVGAVCKLRMSHAGLEPESEYTKQLVEGWGQIISGLKTWLETGESLF